MSKRDVGLNVTSLAEAIYNFTRDRQISHGETINYLIQELHKQGERDKENFKRTANAIIQGSNTEFIKLTSLKPEQPVDPIELKKAKKNLKANLIESRPYDPKLPLGSVIMEFLYDLEYKLKGKVYFDHEKRDEETNTYTALWTINLFKDRSNRAGTSFYIEIYLHEEPIKPIPTAKGLGFACYSKWICKAYSRKDANLNLGGGEN
jgi:hypothetical protein